MDGNGDRRLKLKVRLRRQKIGKRYKPNVSEILNTHKHALLTGLLLLIAVVLLFGIFSQFPAPAATPPTGVTVIDYSTFIGQLKAGNVQAVAIQGNDLNGLLASPLTQNHAAAVAPAANRNFERHLSVI